MNHVKNQASDENGYHDSVYYYFYYYYYYSLQMGLYPVAVVLQYKKTQNNKHIHTYLSLNTIHNTQNYKHNKVHVLHTLKTQNGIIST